MKIIKKVWGIIPGLAISILIAVVAKTIESRLPIHIVGASVIALFIGMIIIIQKFGKKRPKWVAS